MSKRASALRIFQRILVNLSMAISCLPLETTLVFGLDQRVTSASQKSEANVSSEAPGTLKGIAEQHTLPAEVTALTAYPLPHCRARLRFFFVHLKNISDEPAIIDGDNTEAQGSNSSIHVSDASILIRSSSGNLSTSGKAKVMAAYLSSAGLAGPIYYELATPEQHRKRDFERSIGIDGVRHAVEAGRFGRRLVMPGDETAGWLAFPYSESELVKELKIPIWFLPMHAAPTYLSLPIGQP